MPTDGTTLGFLHDERKSCLVFWFQLPFRFSLNKLRSKLLSKTNMLMKCSSLTRTEPAKAHSYRRAFFPYLFPKFGNILRYVSTHGGVLSLFMEFSGLQNIKFDKFCIFEEKNRKIWKIKKMGETKLSNIYIYIWEKNVPIIRRSIIAGKEHSWKKCQCVVFPCGNGQQPFLHKNCETKLLSNMYI